MVSRLNALFFLFFLGLLACDYPVQVISVNDAEGILQNTRAPVTRLVRLTDSEFVAARENRLVLSEVNGNHSQTSIPVQLSEQKGEGLYQILFCMPPGKEGVRKFELIETEEANSSFDVTANISDDGQVIVSEGEHRILQYNYQTVYAEDVIRGPDEQEEEHVRSDRDTFVSASIYAVPRSDYIHPLYGPEGEMLTRDWPDGGHPHHRGIFWAWPEVEYGNKKGDIYALQKIFARPSGEIRLSSGPVFGAIEAENFWMWEDQEPLVREKAEIKIYRSDGNSRIIDLTLHFLALKDSITIATRYTNSYGGLNLRMQTPDYQGISYFTDKEEARPQRAWSDFRGLFKGAQSSTGLMVFQHQDNPEYPGAWVDYPSLAWVQPTFPTPGTRYALSQEIPLVLKYRLVIHKGSQPGVPTFENHWDAYHSTDYDF